LNAIGIAMLISTSKVIGDCQSAFFKESESAQSLRSCHQADLRSKVGVGISQSL